VENSVRVLGNETVTMTTDDSVSKVRDYYQKRLGSPMVENEADDTVVFKISDSPMILITINQDKDDSDKTQITVVRTNVQLPKMN
jgi:catechol-2,3-dioxygenase